MKHCEYCPAQASNAWHYVAKKHLCHVCWRKLGVIINTTLTSTAQAFATLVALNALERD